MNTSDAEKINQLIAELDQKVPREGAVVKITQIGGGPDESKIVANSTGYLRFGIEFLKAAVQPLSDKQPSQVEVDLKYLISEDSDFGFDWCERRENVQGKIRVPINKRLSNSFLSLGCYVVVILFLVLAVIGFISLIK